MQSKQLSKEEAVKLGLKIGDEMVVRDSQAKQGNYNEVVGCLVTIKEMKNSFAIIRIIDDPNSTRNWTNIWAVSYVDLLPERTAKLAIAKRQLVKLEL